MKTIISSQGDTLSAIAYRHYGESRGQVERILEANHYLCAQPALLPAGIAIRLPEAQPKQTTIPTLTLWD